MKLCCLRRETAFSPESAAGSSEAGSYTVEILSTLLRGEAQIVGGVLELAIIGLQEMGRLSPPESVTGF